MDLTLLFICLSLLVNLIQGQTNKIIEIGQNITDSIDDSKQTKYYQFNVKENPSKSDIIIRVFPKDQMENFCDPDLYVSKVLLFLSFRLFLHQGKEMPLGLQHHTEKIL